MFLHFQKHLSWLYDSLLVLKAEIRDTSVQDACKSPLESEFFLSL